MGGASGCGLGVHAFHMLTRCYNYRQILAMLIAFPHPCVFMCTEWVAFPMASFFGKAIVFQFLPKNPAVAGTDGNDFISQKISAIIL